MKTELSRRQWIGSNLAACGYLAAGGFAYGQSKETLEWQGYTRPGPVTVRGRAPGMQARLVAENPGGEKTYTVIFGKGDEVLSGLTEFAESEKLTAGYFTGIGALQSAQFGWFDAARQAYRDIPIDQQVELISLIGDIGLVNGRPQIHAHAGVGLPDGRMRGGHLLTAFAWPTLEVFLTACPVGLTKKRDEETNLFLFDLKA